MMKKSLVVFTKILDDAGDLHLVDYRPIVSKAFCPANVPVIIETVQDYCQDMFAVEEHILKKLSMFYGPPTVRDIVCKYPEVRQWLNDIYKLLLYTEDLKRRSYDACTPVYLWARLFVTAVFNVGDTCARPFCRLRNPPECICGRPLLLRRGLISRGSRWSNVVYM